LGLIGAAAAFIVGLIQYRRAQQWNRAEFLANEIKDLLADRKAAAALTMCDWSSRDINLPTTDDSKDVKRTRVDRELQSQALLPHTFPESSQYGGDQMRTDEQAEAEALIRDCFDALLDRFDRLGSYLRLQLLTVENMRPYIGYYADDIAAPTTDAKDAFWCVCLPTYIHVYHFQDIPLFFSRFNHDIRPDGAIFTGFLVKVSTDKSALAKRLQGAAMEESRPQ
jgi:hypothetical protein